MARDSDVAIMAFPEKETSRLVDLSLWQLRHWSRDLYKPHYEIGFYTFRDLVSLRTLATLRQKTTKQQLVRVGEHLRKYYDAPWSSLRFGLGPHRRVYFADPRTGRWLSADEAQQNITPIALDEIPAKLEREVRKARQRDPATIGRVTRTRGICGNRPRIDGTRIAVDALKPYFDEKRSITAILKEFPTLKRADVQAARDYLATG